MYVPKKASRRTPGLGPALEEVSAAFEAMGADLLAAEAAADAAVAWRKAGDPPQGVGRRAEAER
jgi:hypothetical protein